MRVSEERKKANRFYKARKEIAALCGHVVVDEKTGEKKFEYIRDISVGSSMYAHNHGINDPEAMSEWMDIVADYETHPTLTAADLFTEGDAVVNPALTKFDDNDKVSSWAADSMEWAIGQGILKGVSDKELDPNGPVTREMLCTFMKRMYDSMTK